MWGAIIGAAASLYGNSQNQKGAHAGQEAAQQGLDWTKQVYQDAQGNFHPYLDIGQTGLAGLNKLASGDYSGFNTSPDYLYARDQAQYGIEHGAAARGSLYSPGTNVDLARELSGIASQNLGSYRNSLMGLAGLGIQAASNLGSIGVGQSGNVQAGYNAIGNARQQGYDSTGQLAAGLGGLFNNWYQGRNNQYNPYSSSYDSNNDVLSPYYTNTRNSYAGNLDNGDWGGTSFWGTPYSNTDIGWGGP